MKVGTIIAITAIGLAVTGQAFAATAEEIARGRALSYQLCASCHQVSTQQRPPMRVYNPRTHEDQAALSFPEIAARNGRDARFVQNTLEEPHFPMRKAVLNDAEKTAIIAYIQSLAAPRN